MQASEIANMARRRTGFTQRQLADASGVPQPTISRIERGRMEPTHELLERILRACGMELVPIDVQADDAVDRTLIREWLSWSTEERARRAALEWKRTAPFRRAG